MARIKSVNVNAISATARGFYWNSKIFTTFTDDNGNKTYYINGNKVSKEEGNAEYIRMRKSNKSWRESKGGKDYIARQRAQYNRLKKSGRWTANQFELSPEQTFKQTVTERGVTYEELIKELEKSIDRYTQYIDNYEQQKRAEAHNSEIQRKINKLNELIAERK